MVCLIASSSPPPHWEMENPITNKEHGKVLFLRWKDLIIGVNSTNICAVDVGMSQRMLFFLTPRLLGASCVVFGWEDDSELDGSVCCEACVHQAPKNEGTRGWWLLLVQPVHGPGFNLCFSGLIGTLTEFQAINQVSIFQEKDCQCTYTEVIFSTHGFEWSSPSFAVCLGVGSTRVLAVGTVCHLSPASCLQQDSLPSSPHTVWPRGTLYSTMLVKY